MLSIDAALRRIYREYYYYIDEMANWLTGAMLLPPPLDVLMMMRICYATLRRQPYRRWHSRHATISCALIRCHCRLLPLHDIGALREITANLLLLLLLSCVYSATLAITRCYALRVALRYYAIITPLLRADFLPCFYARRSLDSFHTISHMPPRR